MRVAANLDMLFQEAGALLQRCEAAAAAGFKCIEISSPYGVEAEKLRAVQERLGLEVVQINSPPGDFEYGERGMACMPRKRDEFRKSIDLAIHYAKMLQCPRIHVIAGIAPKGTPRVQIEQVFVENMIYAAIRLEAEGMVCLIEPINRHTVPGYFIFSYEQALGYLEQIKRPNAKIQLDIFHTQHICGQLMQTIKDLAQHIGHVQVAQIPKRHEPDSSGEVNFDYVFKQLQEAGYDGFIGAEYIPKNSTIAGLGWIENLGLSF